MSDINNNFDVKSIKNKSNEIKLEFIKSVIPQTGIPGNFVPIWKTNNTRKIFYEIKDGHEQKRDWVFFQNNTFYCLYCLCFAINENHFVNGIEYVKGCRITDNLKKHDEAAHHKHAHSTYLKCRESTHKPHQDDSEKRKVVRIIVKTIIYIATHGK